MSVRRCVRCGIFPRKPDGDGYLYVCAACSAEPSLSDEIQMAVQAEPEDPMRRRWWIRDHLGWRGGWSRRDEPVHV